MDMDEECTTVRFRVDEQHAEATLDVLVQGVSFVYLRVLGG
jgi:hypothetical protein